MPDKKSQNTRALGDLFDRHQDPGQPVQKPKDRARLAKKSPAILEPVAVGDYYTDKEVAGKLKVSRPTIWRWVKAGTFPSPLKLSQGTSRWSEQQLAAYILRLKSARQGGNSR